MINSFNSNVLDAFKADYLYVEDYNDQENDELEKYKGTAMGAMIEEWDRLLNYALQDPCYEPRYTAADLTGRGGYKRA